MGVRADAIEQKHLSQDQPATPAYTVNIEYIHGTKKTGIVAKQISNCHTSRSVPSALHVAFVALKSGRSESFKGHVLKLAGAASACLAMNRNTAMHNSLLIVLVITLLLHPHFTPRGACACAVIAGASPG